jgi:ribonuclease BN (tRNA processing enzyme)
MENKLRFIQLGNGGGLKPLETNSSFLIEVKSEEFLLFDCGFNIMSRLVELENSTEVSEDFFHISMIKYVYVSHVHDDHVGNLETLMFWNFFKNNVSMTFLYGNDEVKDYLNKKIFPKLFNGSRIDTFSKVCSKIYSIGEFGRIDGEQHKVFIESLQKTFHGDCQSNGVIIKYRKNTSESNGNLTNCIIISGDTKASEDLEKEIQDKTGYIPNRIIYHDYSDWDCPSKNVHACESDFRAEYSEEFRDSLIKYHDNGYFKKEFQYWV